jgi:hypothetical protein
VVAGFDLPLEVFFLCECEVEGFRVVGDLKVTPQLALGGIKPFPDCGASDGVVDDCLVLLK